MQNHTLACTKVIHVIRPCLRNCLFGIADPGVHRVGRSITFFFFSQKEMEVSASNLFEMQAKLYAELTDDIFRYYSVPKNSQLKHKTSLSEPLSSNKTYDCSHSQRLFLCPPFCHCRSSSMWRFAHYFLSHR